MQRMGVVCRQSDCQIAKSKACVCGLYFAYRADYINERCNQMRVKGRSNSCAHCVQLDYSDVFSSGHSATECSIAGTQL